MERILSTIVDLPASEEFPLTFRIADALDGSGCHNIYNQTYIQPLHYIHTGIFRWFNLLAITMEKLSWSPTPHAIKQSMKFLQSIIQEQIGLKVDQPDSSGVATSTGNVAQRAFSDETSFLEYVLSNIAIPHRSAMAKIHAQLAAILKVYNSGSK